MPPPKSGLALVTQATADIPRLLHEWTGLEVGVEEKLVLPTRGWGRADLVGTLGGVPFVAEVKTAGGVAAVQRAIEAVRASAPPDAFPLVVVPFMSPGGRERCEAAGVSWVDLSGNARLRVAEGGLRVAVWVDGRPDAFRSPGRPRNAFAPKAARVARLLLEDPGRPWTQAEIARATGLGPDYVSRIVRDLEDDRLAERADGAVRVPDPALLLDAWADSDAFSHGAIAGHVPGRSGEERARRLHDALGGHGLRHAVTGLAAAWAYTHAAAFRSVSCYVEGGVDVRARALADAGFRADSAAPNARVLVPSDDGVFSGARPAEGLICVAPVQAFVDLAHEPERAAEFREALRERALPWSGAPLPHPAP